MLLAWRIAIPFIFALLLPPWCEALLLRTTPFQLCWDTYIEVLFTLAYSTRLKEEEGLRGLAQLFSLVQLSRILRFYDENWTAQLIRAALPYPYLHERLINSKRLRLLKITPPPDGIVGVVKPNWKEGGSLEKIAYNEEELVRSMQVCVYLLVK